MKYATYLLGMLVLSSTEALKLSSKLTRKPEALAESNDEGKACPEQRVQLDISNQLAASDSKNLKRAQ